MGKNARVKWKSRRKFSQSRTFHSYPIGLHIIFSISSCAKLAVYLVWWVASFLFKFSDKVCDISKLCNFLTMHVAYLSIQFSDNACDISVNPFYANEWNIVFYFISVLQMKFDFRIEKWRWLGLFCLSFYVMKYVRHQYRFFFYLSYEEHRIGLFLWWSTYSNSRWIFLFMPSKVSNIAKLMWIT